jgi:hypothetical protein
LSSLRHLIHFDRVDRPVCLSEIRRIVANKIDARIPAVSVRTHGTLVVLAVDVSSPVTAEVCVYNNTHVAEMLVDVTLALCVDCR